MDGQALLSLANASRLIRPDTGRLITGPGRKVSSCRARSDRRDSIRVALEHELSLTGTWIPEPNTMVPRARNDPLVIRRKGDALYVILY
jgi:hypothetical protein